MIEKTFRDASFDAAKWALWVIQRHAEVSWRCLLLHPIADNGSGAFMNYFGRLLMPLFGAEPRSTVRTSPRIWLNDEADDSVAHGWQSWLRRWPVDFFSPPHFCEAAMLEEGVSDHRHERVTMKTLPGPPFEVVEAGTIRISVWGRVVRHEFTNRSLNMTANWVFASAHSRGGRFHSAVARFKTKYNSLVAASSEGKCPLVLTARRSLGDQESDQNTG